MKRYRAVVARGLSYETISRSGTKLRRLHTESTQLNLAQREYLSALAKLGLRPFSRSRVKVLSAPEPKNEPEIGEYFN
jgi:hypothetical protein